MGCRNKPKPNTEPKCKKCNKPISSAEIEYCYDCSMKKFHYVRGYSVWLYDAVMKRSIIDFKYKGRKEYTGYYVGEMIRHLGYEIREICPDVIIPIPVHPSRKRQRGYNQAELLACELGRRMHLLTRTDILVRVVKTRPQKELNNVERMKNLERAFCVRQTEEDYSKFHRVLLIDDIYTTGSTIEACAKALKRAGMGNVYFITLCIGQGF